MFVRVGTEVLRHPPSSHLLEVTPWPEGVAVWQVLKSVSRGVTCTEEETVAASPTVDFAEVGSDKGGTHSNAVFKGRSPDDSAR